ncbi:MAG TPA: 3'(2'),5'-bisphosphate nucleotidase CysQ [Sphingomonadales bacterium]|nr:3'(2'),5'-bisphosphate nucleotidase CysQ [Sphingomonadales bacterium]
MVLESLDKEFDALQSAVRDAGALALAKIKAGGVKGWLKRGVEPVTEVDLAVNALLKERLPGKSYGWLSEESADDPARLRKARVWVVDPIDGTRALLKGKSDFAISAALVVDGAPALGVIFAPAREEFYSARRGAGAFRNGQPIRVSGRKELLGARIQADRDYLTSRRWAEPWPEATIGKHQSFALRLAAVAAGVYDLAISAKPKSEWDVAAGHLLLEEAGGLCCGGSGERLSYNHPVPRFAKIVAATPGLKRAVLAQLKRRRS